MKPKPKPKPKSSCYFCNKKLTREFYCYGCKNYVCSDCDLGDAIGHGHDVKQHHAKYWAG